jgi:hypothetical protein
MGAFRRHLTPGQLFYNVIEAGSLLVLSDSAQHKRAPSLGVEGEGVGARRTRSCNAGLLSYLIPLPIDPLT